VPDITLGNVPSLDLAENGTSIKVHRIGLGNEAHRLSQEPRQCTVVGIPVGADKTVNIEENGGQEELPVFFQIAAGVTQGDSPLTLHTVTGQGYFQTLTMRVMLEIYGSWTISPGVTYDFVFETR
jgi:hypothetical protein